MSTINSELQFIKRLLKLQSHVTLSGYLTESIRRIDHLIKEGENNENIKH